MKYIMTPQDIMAIIAEIKSLGECRINNIYDIDTKFLSLKIRNNVNKTYNFIMIDAGKKIYISSNKIDVNKKIPSSFVAKLRKHLDNKLILNIEQINYDRIIDISFGYTDVQYHLIVEFYASGNIIFTDDKYVILTQSHNHMYEKGDKKVYAKVGSIFPLKMSAIDKDAYNITENMFSEWYENYKKNNNIDNNNIKSIKNIILQSPLNIFGKDVIEHSLNNVNIDSLDEKNNVFLLLNSIKENHIITEKCKGYIVYENQKPLLYTPILYKQYENKTVNFYPTFSNAVYEYHELIKEKIDMKNVSNETKAKNKTKDKDKQKIFNIMNQIKKMEQKYEDNNNKIIIFETNIGIIGTILEHINKYNNHCIETLEMYLDNLNEGLSLFAKDFKVSVIFQNTNKVNIKEKKICIYYLPQKYNYICNPNTSPYDNVSLMYQDNKKLLGKIESTKNLLQENTKEHIQTEAKEHIEKETIEENINDVNLKQRKYMWYEQFHWFFSSENHLVIVGKNAEQNETLVKKYLDKNDIYVHSEVSGSGSGVIKRNEKSNMTYITYEEASIFLMCHTKAWNANSPDRTYWVNAEQVSKTPESGEYVSKGSFIIRGTKNFMLPPKLELGMTIMSKDKDSDILSKNISEKTEFVLPMCAPYKCIYKNTFKIKIIPGTGKIDKTIKNNIIKIFNKQTKSKKDIEYIKSIQFEEYQKIMVNNNKIL